MRCPICNDDVEAAEQAMRWGPEFAHARCVTAYNYGKLDAASSEYLKGLEDALSAAVDAVAFTGGTVDTEAYVRAAIEALKAEL